MAINFYRLACKAIFCLLPLALYAGKPISPQFVEKHLAPAHVAQQLDKVFADAQLVDAIKNQRADVLEAAGFYIYPTHDHNIIAEHPDVPGWLIKGPRAKRLEEITNGMRNLMRIPEAERIRAFIKKHGYEKYILVPEKYYYRYPGHPTHLCNENYCVIAEKINISRRAVTSLSATTVRSVIHTAVGTGFWDSASHLLSRHCAANIVSTADGRAAFIDTEPFTLKTIALNFRYYLFGF